MTKKLVLRIEDLITVDGLTDNQTAFLDYYHSFAVHMLHGTAGTGKTFLSIYKALEDVLDKGTPYKKLILVRSGVPARNLGFTPGTIEEKMEMYEVPYAVMCKDLLGRVDAYTRLKEQKLLEFISTSYVRGMTFDNAIVVVDEMQNLDYGELYTIFTRIGVESKIIFCGDTKQVDLPTKKGIDKFMKVLYNMPSALKTEFCINDIVRGDLVKEFIIIEENLYGGN